MLRLLVELVVQGGARAQVRRDGHALVGFPLPGIGPLLRHRASLGVATPTGVPGVRRVCHQVFISGLYQSVRSPARPAGGTLVMASCNGVLLVVPQVAMPSRRSGDTAEIADERASPNDVVTLATDRGPAPMNIGAILIVDDAADLDFSTVTSILKGRLPRVRRLRQRLTWTPPGCGRPIWVDDPGFDLSKPPVRSALPAASACAADPGRLTDERVLEIAATMVCTRLTIVAEPLAARWVTGVAGERAALILVMHSARRRCRRLAVSRRWAMAAGIRRRPLSQPPPRARSLFAAAWRDRSGGSRRGSRRLRGGRDGLRELGLPGQAADARPHAPR